MNTKTRVATAGFLCCSALVIALLSPRPAAVRDRVPDSPASRLAYAKLPLAFEANVGQTDPQVQYLARGNGYTVFLTRSESVVALQDRQSASAVVRLRLTNANNAPRIAALKQLPGKSNYFIGSDPANWRTNVSMFSEVRYDGVYPGINLLYHGNQRQLECDFVVAPGANPHAIKLNFEGAAKIDINNEGDLVLHAAEKEIRFRKPIAYQDIGSSRREVGVRYLLDGKSGAGFELASYDTTKPLVIDPVLLYSTYLGGSGSETAQAIAVDANGNAYVAGYTNSLNFPVTPGAFQTTNRADTGFGPDGYVAKLNPAGNQIVYATYLGGSCTDVIYGIAVDSFGEAYVTGQSGSGISPQTMMPDCGPLPGQFFEFPRVNAFQNTYAGSGDAFITKLSADGSQLVFSSFLGGSSLEFGRGIAVDALGNAYATGDTISPNFPTTLGAFQTINAGSSDAYVTKASAVGALIYSTLLGGGDLDSGRGIAVDDQGNAFVTGTTGSGSINGCGQIQSPPAFPTTPGAYQTAIAPSASSPCMCCPPNNIQYVPNLFDAFVTKLNTSGTALVYSTYLGGGFVQPNSGGAAYDEGHSIAVDSNGNAYITGAAGSTNFPTMNAVQPNHSNGDQADAFVTKLNAAGSDLVYSTYLGSDGFDEGAGIAVDSLGEAFVTGTSSGGNFPNVDPIPPPGPTPPPFPPPPAIPGGFVTKFAASGNPLVFSTGIFATTNGKGIGLDPAANAYVTGDTQGGIQTVNAAQPNYAGGGDAYVLKVGPPSAPVAQGAVSRKTHGGGAGDFDVDLPFTGTPGIECRSGGATNDYTMVVTFATNVTVTGSPQAEVTSGTGTVGSGGVSNGGMVMVTGNIVTIPLTNIANQQTINVTLNGVNNTSVADTPTVNVVIPMSRLHGDTSANGAVNSTDISQTKARLGQSLTIVNFRSDIDANGGINSSDVLIAKANSGTALPP